MMARAGAKTRPVITEGMSVREREKVYEEMRRQNPAGVERGRSEGRTEKGRKQKKGTTETEEQAQAGPLLRRLRSRVNRIREKIKAGRLI